MNAYSSLARHYDSLTQDVPYGKMADYYEKLFMLYGLQVKTILDMACGTGTLTCLLAQRGYDMIGTDSSVEMLSAAADKSDSLENRPMFLRQSMERLDLYGTVDAVICSLDGINYVKPDKLEIVLHRVRLFLEPNGVFIFDIHVPSVLRRLDGDIFLDETHEVYCVWRAEFDESEAACVYCIDIFERTGTGWARSREEHIEYAYEPEYIRKALENEGFVDVRLYGDLSMSSPTDSDKRIFVTARKSK